MDTTIATATNTTGSYLLIQNRNASDRGDLVSRHDTLHELMEELRRCGIHPATLAYDHIGDPDYIAPRGI